MIPKIIHCCWLSGEPKTKLAERCMASWRRFAADWTIREWTIEEIRQACEHGEMPSAPSFFEDAVKAKKWAFAADWVRFAALQAEGGVYLDFDVELVRTLAVDGEFVAGQWMPNGNVGMEPAVIALEKGSAIAKAMVDFYAKAQFGVRRTAGEILHEVVGHGGITVDVLRPEVFCPIGIDGVARCTDRTVGIHRYAMSWATPGRKVARWFSWHGMRWVVNALLDLRRKMSKSNWAVRIAVCAAVVLTAASVVQGFRNGLECVDFHWESAALIIRGENPYRWFFDGRFYDGVIVDATQAPSTIAFILPFGLLPHALANTLWDVCNLGFTALFIFFVGRLFFVRAKGGMAPGFWAFAALFLCGAPWRVGMGCGQHTMFSIAFFAAALWAMERRSHWLVVGALLSAALFKYTVTVPLAFVFVIRRQWKALAVAGAIHIALTVALGLWTGTDPVALVRQSIEVGCRLNQSGGDADLAGLASRFGVVDAWPWARAGYAVFGSAILAYTIVRLIGRLRDMPLLVDLSVLAILADLVFYHRCYDLVSLAFPLAFCILRPLGARTLLPWLLVVNAFFLLRIDFAVGIGFYAPLGFALHVLALVSFVGWMGKERAVK